MTDFLLSIAPIFKLSVLSQFFLLLLLATVLLIIKCATSKRAPIYKDAITAGAISLTAYSLWAIFKLAIGPSLDGSNVALDGSVPSDLSSDLVIPFFWATFLHVIMLVNQTINYIFIEN
ncbi:hypothetical protein TW78_09705 [Vibrio coralliilyticus]|uniref:Uncharacterized protein n=1 Tax=Vibrio coralliilyticus TaxID=190893 RepID=A0A837G9N7_9VIBR|nr:hypothetical protein [Vibrio coralliilyticus]KJY73443.1 hypothetical protein TW78_09705 [Vibrio coralliilyticus]QOU33240.1 hypothetical protein TW71_025000 [Vibrio coralliilyticus]